MAKTDAGAVSAAYTKEQLTRSERYANSRDLISALLENYLYFFSLFGLQS